MKREDVLKVDELKDELSDAFRQFERRMVGVFGQLVYGIDTVIERYNDLDAKLDAVSRRLLVLERDRGREQ
jgi:hypothetical protein